MISFCEKNVCFKIIDARRSFEDNIDGMTQGVFAMESHQSCSGIPTAIEDGRLLHVKYNTITMADEFHDYYIQIYLYGTIYIKIVVGINKFTLKGILK